MTLPLSPLLSLLSVDPSPPLIHLHHPHHPSPLSFPSFPSRCIPIRLNCVEHHTSRLLYSGICNALSDELGLGDEGEEVGGWDGMVVRLREIWNIGARDKGKGKEKANVRVNGHLTGRRRVNGEINGHGQKDEEVDAIEVQREEGEERQIVLIIEKAERLRSILGHQWAVITRFSELVGIPASVILISQIPWDETRPPLGDALEPVHVFLPSPTRDELLTSLLPCSPHPIWPHFLSLLLSTLLPLLPSPLQEIHYLSTSLFPIYTSYLPPHLESSLLQASPSHPLPSSSSSSSTTQNLKPLEITVNLLTTLKHHLSLPLAFAIESLLPRQSCSHQFTQSFLAPSSSFSSLQPSSPFPLSSPRTAPKPLTLNLPLLAKYLLISSYFTSYNPPKSDYRLFGRSSILGKRKRGGGTRRAGYGRLRVGKVPQRLVGPKSFGVERLVAVFRAVYEEWGERPEDLQAGLGVEGSEESSEEEGLGTRGEGRGGGGRRGQGWAERVLRRENREKRKREKERERDERWEEEVEHLSMSVGLWSLIPKLESQSLLRRTSPPDRLDNITLRCEIDYEQAKVFARDLGVVLDDYLYEGSG